jgi:hypothetical protein
MVIRLQMSYNGYSLVNDFFKENVMKLRISKNGKFAKEFPKNTANKIRSVAETYHGLKSVEIVDCTQEKTFYVGEGESYTGIKPDGQQVGFKVVSQNTIGASNLSHSIGKSFNMPPESYLIKVSYYTKYFMTIYRIGKNEACLDDEQHEYKSELPEKISGNAEHNVFEPYIFIDDDGQIFVKQKTFEGIVDTPIDEFYERCYVVNYLYYNSERYIGITNPQLFNKIYLMCDGFGHVTHDYTVNSLCFDWSHVRDSTSVALKKAAFELAKELGQYGGIEFMIDDYKAKVEQAMFKGQETFSHFICGDIKLKKDKVNIISEKIYSPFEWQGTTEEFEMLELAQGEKETELTEREKYLLEVDFVLESVLPWSPTSKYRIKLNKEIKLGKRGVIDKGNGKYVVTENVLNKLQEKHTWGSEF